MTEPTPIHEVLMSLTFESVVTAFTSGLMSGLTIVALVVGFGIPLLILLVGIVLLEGFLEKYLGVKIDVEPPEEE